MVRLAAGITASAVLAALVWAAFNNRWADARERPVPAALALAPGTMADEANPFFALAGLEAPADVDPREVGLRQWQQAQVAQLMQLEPSPAQPDAAPPGQGPGAAGARLLPWQSATSGPAYAAWNCKASETDCVAQWWSQADALTQATTGSVPGERCEALVQPGFAFEEPLAAVLLEPRAAAVLGALAGPGSPATASLREAATCLRWLHVRAVLAARDGEPAQMMRRLEQADALTMAALQGARSLVNVMVAHRMAQRHWHVVTDLAARLPGMTGALAALLHPLPPQALDPAVWMRSEYAFARTMSQGMAGAPCQGISVDCLLQFFYQPNATQQLFDRFWSDAVARAAGGPLAMTEWPGTLRKPAGPARQSHADDGLLARLAWRNTLGHELAETSVSSYPVYVRRQANLLLYNEAARLALAARDVPEAERAPWLQQQPVDERLRGRLHLAGGRVEVRGWDDGRWGDSAAFPIPSGVTMAMLPGARSAVRPPGAGDASRQD